MFDNPDLLKAIFGRLSLDSLPLHEPIVVATFAGVALGGAVVFGAITYFKLWGYLWHEWFTSVDHKSIGIMYVILGLIMLLRGFADAIMMRAQQAIAFNGSEGYLPAAPLRSNLHCPWRDHDLLRGDAARHGLDELRGAFADRRARRRVSVPQQLQLLDDGRRRAVW